MCVDPSNSRSIHMIVSPSTVSHPSELLTASHPTVRLHQQSVHSRTHWTVASYLTISHPFDYKYVPSSDRKSIHLTISPFIDPAVNPSIRTSVTSSIILLTSQPSVHLSNHPSGALNDTTH